MLEISKRYGIRPHMAGIRQKMIEVRPDVLEAVDEEALRHGRSANKQIEAILLTYYGLADVNIRDMSAIRDAVEQFPGEIAITVDETDSKLGGDMAERRLQKQSTKSPRAKKGKPKRR